MTDGRSSTASCAARAALAGNPSDAYGGAVVAVPVRGLEASVTVTAADRWSTDVDDPELARLLRATLAGWTERCQLDSFPSVTVGAETVIPRSVGLGGSSALVIATLRALAALVDHHWEPIELARLALDIETIRLRITAGLQDRLVQAVDEPVAMTFDPDGYDVLRLPGDLPLFVAWATESAKPSGTVHRSLRERFDEREPAVVDAMRELTTQAALARAAVESGDLTALGAAMDRSFDLRASILDVGDRQRELVAVGRSGGAWVNSAGSGGSVVGLVAERSSIAPLRSAYAAAGAEFLALV